MFVSTSWLLLAYSIQKIWEDLDSQMNELRIQWLLKDSNKGYSEWKYWQNRNYYHYEIALAMLFLRKKEAIFERLNMVEEHNGQLPQQQGQLSGMHHPEIRGQRHFAVHLPVRLDGVHDIRPAARLPWQGKRQERDLALRPWQAQLHHREHLVRAAIARG